MLGSKKVGKTGLVAEMPLSRTISAMGKFDASFGVSECNVLEEMVMLSRLFRTFYRRLGDPTDKVWGAVPLKAPRAPQVA